MEALEITKDGPTPTVLEARTAALERQLQRQSSAANTQTALYGFTSFSEGADPEEVSGVLREYHKAMGELIMEHGGTLGHFAGDGMMVFFNDPVLRDDHVERAVRMSLAMRDQFGILNADWARRGHTLGFGIGIATGYATLGRIGFEGRYDYGWSASR